MLAGGVKSFLQGADIVVIQKCGVISWNFLFNLPHAQGTVGTTSWQRELLVHSDPQSQGNTTYVGR